MSAENVEIVRDIYRAWEEGSPLESGLIADDIEWVNAKEAVEPGPPASGTRLSRASAALR